MDDPRNDGHRRRAMILLSVGTGVVVLSAVPAVFALMATLMSGGSGGGWWILALGANLAYLVVAPISLVVGWVCYAARRDRAAYGFAWAPLASLLVAVVCVLGMLVAM